MKGFEILGRSLSNAEMKKITGGLEDFKKYDPDDPCQNWVEIVPAGCPCSSDSQCPRRYGPGMWGSNTGPVTIPGACVNGVCAAP